MTDLHAPIRHIGHPSGTPSPNYWRSFPPQLLTPEEVTAIIGGCSAQSRTGIRNRALLTLFYRSGIRISEAIGAPARPERRFRGRDGREKIQPPQPAIPPLKLSAVDLKAHSLRLLDTKSGKPQTRGFHPSAEDTLLRWTDVRKDMGLRGGPMFCTLAGDPLQAPYVRLLLKRLAAQAGVDKRVHPHGFRHTFAVELLQAGVDVATISKLLGHSSIAVTARYLDHLTNYQAVTALEAVDLPPLGA